jgi:hypothetical protein
MSSRDSLPFDRGGAFDQPIKLFEIGHKGIDVMSCLGAQLDEIPERLSLAQIVMVDRGDVLVLFQGPENAPWSF